MPQSFREVHERAEAVLLGTRAVASFSSRGRARPEAPDPLRTEFGRDRDRIIHSKAFRRLGHKTQVFLAPEGDHYRVRLTHTLEVTQIARTIARALRLNEDLVEAICLGHDLGHTPFGHLGEVAVAEWYPGFRHNLQSVRIVDVLERLNLTWEVRDGIANHTWSMPMPATLEGQIARFADRIAYINHDIDDAVRAGILDPSHLPGETMEVLGRTSSERIRTMVLDLVTTSEDSDTIRMTPRVFDAMATTRAFLFEHVYLGRIAALTRDAVGTIVTSLLDFFCSTPPPGDASEDASDDPKVRAVDYVAGMTDRFALRAFEEAVGAPSPALGGLG